MPIVWNAQADAQLLVALVQVYDVKVSGEKLNEVARLMGNDCTAKALTHRISKLKKLAKTGSLDGSSKPAAGEGKGKGKAKKADTPVDGGDDEEEGPKVKKAAGGGKRKKGKVEEGEEEGGPGKMVKAEEEEDDMDEI